MDNRVVTTPRRLPGRSRRRSARAPKVRASQVVGIVVVLAVFLTGVVVAGVVGAVLVGLLAIGAGALLAVRWRALDERVRLFRALVVLIALAVAISLLYR